MSARRHAVQSRTNAVARGGSVGHEEDGVAVVLAAGVCLGQVGLGLFDQVVLVLTGDRLAARAIQMGLHI